MRFRVSKLDKRHNGNHLFSHYTNFGNVYSTETKLAFVEMRNWCWESWGPGMEIDYACALGSNQYQVCRWAWQTDHGNCRIYFSSQKELNWFILKWGSQ